MAEQEMAAYIRGYLEKKAGLNKWDKYWCVVKGPMMFFFLDPNTHVPENFASSVGLSPQTVVKECGGKKDFMFEVKSTTGNHRFKCENNLRRVQWLFAIKLASTLQPPAPLPGEGGFDSAPSAPPVPTGQRPKFRPLQRANTQPTIPTFTNHYEVEKPEDKRRSVEGAEQENQYDIMNLSDSSWFLGNVSRVQSEKLLGDQPVGTFLIRESETAITPGNYTLSIRRDDRVFHHKIISHNNGLIFNSQEHHIYNDLSSLVESYARSNKHLKVRPYSESVDDDGYAMLDEKEDASVEKEEPKNLGPRNSGDGYEECNPADGILAKEVIRSPVSDPFDPNVNKIPLPDPYAKKDEEIAYMHMSPASSPHDARRFVPGADASLPMKPAYENLDPMAGMMTSELARLQLLYPPGVSGKRFVPEPEPEVDSEYLPMHGPRTSSFNEELELEYQNMPPPEPPSKPSSSSYVNMPPLPPRRRHSTTDILPPELPPRQSDMPPELPSRPPPKLRKAYSTKK